MSNGSLSSRFREMKARRTEASDDYKPKSKTPEELLDLFDMPEGLTYEQVHRCLTAFINFRIKVCPPRFQPCKVYNEQMLQSAIGTLWDMEEREQEEKKKKEQEENKQ